jgi:hypothetical protein
MNKINEGRLDSIKDIIRPSTLRMVRSPAKPTKAPGPDPSNASLNSPFQKKQKNSSQGSKPAKTTKSGKRRNNNYLETILS